MALYKFLTVTAALLMLFVAFHDVEAADGELNQNCAAGQTCIATTTDVCDTNRGTSQCKRKIDMSCIEGDCVAGSTCTNGVCSSCSTIVSTRNAVSGLCDPKDSYPRGTCSGSCIPANSNCSTITGKCQCKGGYRIAYADYTCVVSITTILPPTIASAAATTTLPTTTTTASAAPGDLNQACVSNACTAADDVCDTKRASARCKRRIARACKEGDCVAGSTCTNGVCSSCTSTSTLNSATDLCDPKPNYVGGGCSNSSCVTANSECSASISGTCRCKTGYEIVYTDFSCSGANLITTSGLLVIALFVVTKQFFQ